jgi:small subunit ribosomal protein S13
MPRIIGTDIPEKKRLIISLQYIYGVGPKIAAEIIERLGLNGDMRARELSQEEISKLNAMLQDQFTVEGELRREVKNNINRLVSTGTYRGRRHRAGLPVRGQRTCSNARTRKGKKKTVANKKK